MAQPRQDNDGLQTDQTQHLNHSHGNTLKFCGIDADEFESFSTEQFGLARSVGTQSCVDFRIISRQSQIVIRCNGVITDNDDTVLLHTGEHIHDGHLARFARGLSQILVEIHNSGQHSFLELGHLEIYAETRSIFTPETWNPYREKTGKSEDTVLRGILELAHERFAHSDKPIDVDHYRTVVNGILDRDFDSFMRHVQTDPHLLSLFQSINAVGIPVAGCSASSAVFGERALASKNIRHLFHSFIWGAVKKSHSGDYSGDDIRKACEAIRVKPNEAVMFGDTMNDIGAAKLAGIPLTIIRLPGAVSGDEGANANLIGMMQKELSNQVDTFGRRPDYHGHVSTLCRGTRPTVLLVHDFRQVRFGSRLLAEDKNSTFRETHGQDSNDRVFV
jgi:beta-phosphoglucomutase-like phosphatase (HAD superfamily)